MFYGKMESRKGHNLSRTRGGDPVAVHEFLHQMKSFPHKRGTI
jgi:hypothetical protein